ncbi:hypothetical protein CRUP_036306 [Coryphaenoides rupestris]|nr:hypothetical protein CRUP_036306 [Coryphaenoides rupestris]
MEPNAASTILRVKRKRGTEPADALLLACKRVRRPERDGGSQPGPAGDHTAVPGPGGGDDGGAEVEEVVDNSVFKLVATVATQDAPVQAQVREALARPRVAHALRPSTGSSQRVVGDLRSAKWSTRREERYRILSSHRSAGLAPPRAPPRPTDPRDDDDTADDNTTAADAAVEGQGQQEKGWGLGKVQTLSADPEVILCNNMKMLRERLSVSGERPGAEHREHEDDYVYDLYCQETAAPGWIQDILSVRAYADEGELVPDLVVHEEEVYEDEDDENEEGNWRNDYPDSDDGDSDREERYGGYWEEEHSYSRRSWDHYQRELLRELGCHGEKQDGDDEDDEDDDRCDSN